MSIYYNDYLQELWDTANVGETGCITLTNPIYSIVFLYWETLKNKELTVDEELRLPIENKEALLIQQRQLERVKYIMTCPLDDVPLYIDDSILMFIAKKRLHNGQ